MTNFERLEPAIKILFGDGWNPETFSEFYADAMDIEDCDGCIVGNVECTHRMGQITFEEFEKIRISEDDDSWWDDTGNGKTCRDVLLEYLNEECES